MLSFLKKGEVFFFFFFFFFLKISTSTEIRSNSSLTMPYENIFTDKC